MANAIEHGSDGPHSTVSVRVVEEESGALALYITDDGSFVPRMQDRGVMPERGRGLAFMDLLMDEVDVRPGEDGTEVRLVMRLA